MITQMAEPKQGPGQNSHLFDPTRNFNDLPDQQPDGDKHHQSQHGPQQSGDKLRGIQILDEHQGAEYKYQRNTQLYEQGSIWFFFVAFSRFGVNHLKLNFSLGLNSGSGFDVQSVYRSGQAEFHTRVLRLSFAVAILARLLG